MYQATISSAGQITIPKKVRDALGVKSGDRIRLDLTGDKATLTRVRSIEETLDYLDSLKTPEIRAAEQRLAGKSVHELFDEWSASPDGRQYYKERLGAI